MHTDATLNQMKITGFSNLCSLKTMQNEMKNIWLRYADEYVILNRSFYIV